MRGPACTVATLLVLGPLLLAPTAAVPGSSSLSLFAHWPSDVATAMEEPIPLTPLSPLGEPDLSEGSVAPGSSTAGTQATFTYQLVNPNGTDGPFGDVPLDRSRPVLLDFYLSADQTPWPSTAGDPPREVDHGVAPRLTVEATLRIGGQAAGSDQVTQTLVTAPPPAGTGPTRYLLELELEQDTLRKGEGLTVEIAIHQIDREGEQAHQPFWNVHTGEAYPTGIVLPTDPQPEQARLDARSMTLEEARATRSTAWVVLVASLGIAALAGARMLAGVRD